LNLTLAKSVSKVGDWGAKPWRLVVWHN